MRYSKMCVFIFFFGSILFGGSIFAASPSELDTAVNWLYQKGLTKYNNTQSFRPNDALTREQLAKFILQYASAISFPTTTNWKGYNSEAGSCKFKDRESIDQTLRTDSTNACSLGLVKGSNGNFLPKRELTNEQFAAVLVRMIRGMGDETGEDWSKEYYTFMNSQPIFSDISLLPKKSPITRGTVAILLYRATKLFTYNTYTPTPVVPPQPANKNELPDLIVRQVQVKAIINNKPIYEIVIMNTGVYNLYINNSRTLNNFNGLQATLPNGGAVTLEAPFALNENGGQSLTYNGEELSTENNYIPAFNKDKLIQDYLGTRPGETNPVNNGYADFILKNAYIDSTNPLSINVEIKNVGDDVVITDINKKSLIDVSCTVQTPSKTKTFSTNNACVILSNGVNIRRCSSVWGHNSIYYGNGGFVRLENIDIPPYESGTITCTVNNNQGVFESDYSNNSITVPINHRR